MAGFHYDEKYGANRYADEEEEENGANLLGGLGGGGHAQPGQVQAVNHQVDAEGDQGSGHDPGNPVEEGEGRKGQIQQLVRQEHQTNQGGGQQRSGQAAITQAAQQSLHHQLLRKKQPRCITRWGKWYVNGQPLLPYLYARNTTTGFIPVGTSV